MRTLAEVRPWHKYGAQCFLLSHSSPFRNSRQFRSQGCPCRQPPFIRTVCIKAFFFESCLCLRQAREQSSSHKVTFFHQFYSFQSPDIPPPWFSFFLGILFFLVQLYTVSLISLSASSSSLYRTATDFRILISYPAPFLSSFITLDGFLVESLGFSV